MGFRFSTMGNSLLRDPGAHSRLYKLHSFSILSCSPYCSYYYHLLSFLSRIANPFTSHPILPFIARGKWRCYDYFLISLVWMGVQFHHLEVEVPLGTVVMVSEPVPAAKRLFGSDTPQGNIGLMRPCIPEQSQSQP